MQFCAVCDRETEHIVGKGFALDGCCIDMAHAGPHCVDCTRKLVRTIQETTPQDPPVPDPEEFVMPFGKYKGRTLGDIADDDLLYLDWLAGIELKDRRLQQAVWHICAKRTHEIESLMAGADN